MQTPSEALLIDRQTCSINITTTFSVSILPANATSSLIYGIIGIKHILDSPYLVVITKATQIGLIDGEKIYRMDGAQVISFREFDEQAMNQHDWRKIYVGMLESMLSVPHFYFSYGYDLTSCAARRMSLDRSPSTGKPRDYTDYDARFLWNAHLMKDFDRCQDRAKKYRLPFILGFVSINKMKLTGQEPYWTLISRRSVKRAGTRFNSRGVDHDGNVSNFVETEQIVENTERKRLFSFVQIRGSIPMMWRQTVDYSYKPQIEIDQECDHELLMRRHIDDLLDHYKKVSIVSLIDQKGHESKLAREFNTRMENINRYYEIPFHPFDFHKECSRMRWHNLDTLIESIEQEIKDYHFYEEEDHVPRSYQRGVIRSNCIDSLDRTNVVQSMIAQRVLDQQLYHSTLPANWLGGHKISSNPHLLNVFKNVWADNADALSIQYAGTAALKTDFTRTGQRTHMGMVRDGANSVTRYIHNNFLDNYRQDAIDLFLGNFEGYPSPLYRPMDLTSYTSTFPVTIAILTLILLYFYVRLN